METMTDQELTRKLTNFSHLPSIPQVLLKIKQVAEDPKASPADLANCILSDHQLTSRILRMANSVHYGEYSGKINTVTHAIVLMGFRAVHNIAISMAIFEVVHKFSSHAKWDITGFWTRSLACGVITKYLADRIGQTRLIETAFIAGFMHDIGQAVLAGIFPNKYQPIAMFESSSSDIYKAEQAILGTNHMTVGEILASQWNLPSVLTKCMAKHHRIGLKSSQKSDHILIDLVYLSDLIYPHVLSGTPSDTATYSEIARKAHELVGVSEEAMADLLYSCHKEVAEIAADFEIDIDSEIEKCALHEGDVTVIQRELENKERQLAFLQNAATALMQAKSDDEILQVICEALMRGLRMGRAILLEYDEKRETYSGRVGFGVESQEEVKTLSFSSRSGLFHNIRQSRTAISVVASDKEILRKLLSNEDIAALKAEAFAVIPIPVVDEIKYVIFVDTNDRSLVITDDALRCMTSLASQGAMSLERNLYRRSRDQ